VFGDIKSENVLVREYGRVDLVDYGGMSVIGHSIRQFTEIYDRGYWSAGSRSAEPSYDWFAVGIMWLHAFDEKRLIGLTRTLLPQNRHPRELMKLVRSSPELRPMEDWMEKAFHGRFENSAEACRQWKVTASRTRAGKASIERLPGWMAALFAASIILCVSLAAYWLYQ
jgi:serine/threonine-protein kinase